MVTANKHQLLIMRHAKSDWDSGMSNDFDRPLARRGLRDANRIGAWLAAREPGQVLIIASPAVRARETARIVAGKLGIKDDDMVWDRDIYEASVHDLLAVIERHAGEHTCVLLIGHNPGLDALVSFLADSEPPRTLSGKLMTTAAVAMLEFNDGKVGTERYSAHLSRLLRPKELD